MACLGFASKQHTSFQCILGVGSGGPHPISVTTHNLTIVSDIVIDYASPTISAVNLTGITTQNGTITITGTNFGDSLVPYRAVTVGGQPCTNLILALAHTKLTCVVPPGQGTNILLTVNVVTKSGSSTSLFSYPPPIITSIIPSFAPTSGSVKNDTMTYSTITGLN